MFGMVWYGMVWCGMAWCGMIWYGMVWLGMVWYQMISHGIAWYRMVSYGIVWYGMVCTYVSMCVYPSQTSHRSSGQLWGFHISQRDEWKKRSETHFSIWKNTINIYEHYWHWDYFSGHTNHRSWDYIPLYWVYSYDYTHKQSQHLQDYNELGPDSTGILMEAVQECQGQSGSFPIKQYMICNIFSKCPQDGFFVHDFGEILDNDDSLFPYFLQDLSFFPMIFPMTNQATLVFPGDAPAPKSLASGKQRGPGGQRVFL